MKISGKAGLKLNGFVSIKEIEQDIGFDIFVVSDSIDF